jgi:phytoene dehydrogenase-like protein
MSASRFLGNADGKGVDEMTDEVDVIVVGGGINGLVAAAELAQAGWSVILLERNAEIGGVIATEERTLPGYLHDTFSSWHPMFVSGPAYAALGELLHRHGLEYRNTDDLVTASVADDGPVTLARRDPERTAAEFAHPEDRSVYLTMLQRLGENIGSIDGLLCSELRSFAPVRHISGLIRRSGLRRAEWWLRAAAEISWRVGRPANGRSRSPTVANRSVTNSSGGKTSTPYLLGDELYSPIREPRAVRQRLQGQTRWTPRLAFREGGQFAIASVRVARSGEDKRS